MNEISQKEPAASTLVTLQTEENYTTSMEEGEFMAKLATVKAEVKKVEMMLMMPSLLIKMSSVVSLTKIEKCS